LNTSTIAVVHRHTSVGIIDVGDFGVQTEPWVVRLQELGCHTLDDGVVSALIPYKVVFVAKAIPGQVAASVAKYQRALEWRISVFEVYDC
jgi:hypothetical protein